MSAAGMAGDSAGDVARAAREKAERLIRRAELFERGAEGERIVAHMLAQLPSEWFVLNDLHWPGRDRANIDHVVIGPTGVFVIDAKNWSGSVRISNGTLRQNGYSRKSTTDGAIQAAKAISSVLPSMDPRLVVPVVCFVGEAATNGTVDGVKVCTAATLLSTLQKGRAALTSGQREFVRFDLDMSTDNARQSAAHRRAPVVHSKSTMKSTARTPRVNAHYARPPSRPSPKGHSTLARMLLSFLAWLVSYTFAFVIVGPVSNYQENVMGPVGLVVGAVCGVYAWRRLKAPATKV